MPRSSRAPGWIAAWAVAVAAALSGGPPLPVRAAEERFDPSEILIVVNEESEISRAIGRYYRAARQIPASNVVGVRTPLRDATLSDPRDETTSNANYARRIRDPIQAFLTSDGLADQIRVIVTTKGVPLRISGGPGTMSPTALRDHPRASVDAELALLFSGRDGSPGIVDMANPFFDSRVCFRAFRAANPEAPLRYLVARLTGYQTDLDAETGVPRDVKALIDRGQLPPTPGAWLVDEDASQKPGMAAGNLALLGPAATMLKSVGQFVLHDQTGIFRSDVESVLGYASWGSNDRGDAGPPFYGSVKGRLYPGHFAHGAVSLDIVSSNARTFTFPAVYGQSLIADLIRSGVSGAAGHVYEPTLTAVARPHIFLRRYAQGVPAVDAFFRSVPFLGWTNVYVGDPLLHLPTAAPPDPDDLDGDGVPDRRDNCSQIANSDQRDSNGDGFGNLCDGDVDNDGRVTTSWGAAPPGDLEIIAAAIAGGRYHPDLDLDGNRRVDADDLSLAQIGLLYPPGPGAHGP